MTTIRINSIGALLKTLSGLSSDTHLMENQVMRIRQRIAAGVDAAGNRFAPLKDGSKRRPLANAAQLFGNTHFNVQQRFDGFSMSATVSGRPGVILSVQNKSRNFAGFSADDAERIKEDVRNLMEGRASDAIE